MIALNEIDLDNLSALVAQQESVWLDLRDPVARDLATAAEVLGMHKLALEDSLEFGQRPKLDRYEDQALFVLFGMDMDDEGTPRLVEVHIHVLVGCVITVSRVPLAQLERVRHSLEQGAECSQSQLVYRVIDAVVDSLTDGLETVVAEIDAFERTIFRRTRAGDRDRMSVLRRTLNGVRRTLVIQRQVFGRAVNQIAAHADDSENIRSYLDDVGDHLSQALDETEAHRETLQGLLDTYSSEVQERLTIVATIFLPLTTLTGFFGMNFTWLTDHMGSTWAFFGPGVGGLLASGIVIVLWLRRNGLLDRSRSREWDAD